MLRLAPPLLLCACAASVIPAFEDAKREALRMPGPAPADWRPDAVLRLSSATLDDALTALLREHATLATTLDLGVGTLRPRLEIEGLQVDAAPGCAQCLRLTVDLGGVVKAKSPFAASRLPFGGTATVDVELALAPREGAWTLEATPRSVRRVRVEIGGMNTGLPAIDATVREWIDASLVAGVGTVPIADLGSADLPFRAVAAVPGDGSVEIHVLTDAGVDVAASVGGAPPPSGWSIELATPALVALARRASMAAEPLDFDVVPEPTRLSIDGDRFELGLRLWRIAGRGWWRDYTITGTVETRAKKVALVPTDVRKDAASPGAAFVDPLAFLGQGIILNTIEDAVNATIPNARDERVGGIDAHVAVTAVRGHLGAMVVEGTLALDEVPARGRR